MWSAGQRWRHSERWPLAASVPDGSGQPVPVEVGEKPPLLRIGRIRRGGGACRGRGLGSFRCRPVGLLRCGRLLRAFGRVGSRAGNGPLGGLTRQPQPCLQCARRQKAQSPPPPPARSPESRRKQRAGERNAGASPPSGPASSHGPRGFSRNGLVLPIEPRTLLRIHWPAPHEPPRPPEPLPLERLPQGAAPAGGSANGAGNARSVGSGAVIS